MTDLNYKMACLCCLRMEGNMQSLKSSLGEEFCKFIGIETLPLSVLPQWLCWLCAREVRKARKFQIQAKNSYSLLISLQLHNPQLVGIEAIQRNCEAMENILLPLSQSMLELWCTPDSAVCPYGDFITEEPDVKNDESNDSDSTPLIKLENKNACLFNNDSQSMSPKAKDEPVQFNFLKKKLPKSKKKKNKKRKKKEILKINQRSPAVVLKNRMVLETGQYKVLRLTPDQVLEEKEKTLNSLRYLESPYKCQLCAKGFNYEDVLLNHMSKHDKKIGHLECKMCHQFLPSVISLRGHTKSHLVRYECRECGEVRASRQHLLEHHSLQHRIGNNHPKQYACNICGKTMMKRTMFQKHVRLHSPSSRLPCEKCGKSFKTIETLRAHKLHHEDISARRHAEVKRYKCSDCSKEFRYASLLYTHRVTHITTKNFYCVECDLSFKTQSNLKLHLSKSQKHIDPESLTYHCNECNKKYASEAQLQHHIDCIHMGKREYPCSSCDRQYATKDGLRAHSRKEHPPPGVMPPTVIAKHLCDICNRAFKAKAVLVKHLRTHTGERPFQCVECSRAFSQKSTLATHIKLVHRNKKHKSVKSSEKLYVDSHQEHEGNLRLIQE